MGRVSGDGSGDGSGRSDGSGKSVSVSGESE